jgi:hypothetical protein
VRARVLLLGAQAVCLGVSTALLIVSATSLFLSTYGAALLPYVYIVVALAGVVTTSAMTRVQRHVSLAGLATAVLAVVAGIMVAGWAALALGGLTWATFPLVVLVFLWIPTGFVLVGAQAGRLLDVQQLKAWFPRIAAGFAAGFGAGGLLAARLVSLLGAPEPLLLIAASTVITFLLLALVLARRYPVELRSAPEPPPRSARDERPSLRRLLDNRLVVALLGYQMLSAAVTQLLDYLVWSSAAARYPDPAELARFLGLFGALINVVGLLFVFLLAGRLLSRYGLAFGLAANPTGVILLVVLSTAVAATGGLGTTTLFVLVCAQQVVDIALTDGTTRGSINAAYQALPPRERLAAQTRVEGVGVPGATGAVGVLLLLVQLLGGGVVALLAIVLTLTATWLWLAVAAYRLYGTNLRRTITRRAWDPVALRLEDAASREVVARLLASEDMRDVAVAVDALAAAAPGEVRPAVAMLLRSKDVHRVRIGIDAARRHRLDSLVEAIVDVALSRTWSAEVRAEAVLAAGGLGAGAGVLEGLLDDDDMQVRESAAAALVHARGDGEDVRRVEGLLADDARRTAALHAVAALPSALHVPALVRMSRYGVRMPGLADALASHAAFLEQPAADALDDPKEGRAASLLAQALRASPSPGVDDVLLGHLAHADLGVRTTVVDILAARGPRRDEPRLRAALADEAARAGRCLDALDALGTEARCAPVVRALRDDLRGTTDRVVALLAALHGEAAVRRSVAALVGPGRPLALETLEVTVGRADLAIALPLVDPDATGADQRGMVARPSDGMRLDRDAWLVDLALDPRRVWHDAWLRATAVWALHPAWRATADSAARDDDPLVAETARAWLDGSLSRG